MSERFARNSHGRVPPRSGWRVRSASSPRSCAYRGCRCCPGSSPAPLSPATDHRRTPGVFVPGPLLDRPGSYRQTARVRLGGTAPVDSRERAEAPSASSPARSAADHDQIPCATGSGAGSGRISAGRHALVGVGGAALACKPRPAAVQRGPHVLARTRRQPCTAAAIRAPACSRRCDPARLGNAVGLTRRCLHLRPAADQGAARVNGQGKRPGM